MKKFLLLHLTLLLFIFVSPVYASESEILNGNLNKNTREIEVENKIEEKAESRQGEKDQKEEISSILSSPFFSF